MRGMIRQGRLFTLCGAVLIAAVSCKGPWHVTRDPSPVRAVHVVLLHTGKVLLVAGSGNDLRNFEAGMFKTSLWDPTTETFQDVATPWDAFCSGHAIIPDGRVLVAGGTSAYPS